MSAAPVSAAQIEADVQAFLDSHQPASFRLEVAPNLSRHEDDWWYVVVRPEPPGVRSHLYADALAEVEELLRKEHRRNVLLIPTLGLN